MKEKPALDNRMQGDETDTEREERHALDMRLGEALDRIVRHVGRLENVKYVVHWYC